MPTLTVNPKEIDITHSKAPLFIRFGILCTNTRHIPKWFAYFCYIMSQLETIAMIFKNADLCISDNAETLSAIPKAFYQLLIMSEWVSYDNLSTVNVLLTLIMVYLWVLLGLGIYLILKLRLNCPIPYTCQVIWSTICYGHSLVLLFPIQTLLFSVLGQFYQGTLTPQDSTYTLVVVIFNLTTNVLLSTSSTRLFQVMIKTRDPLSSKSNFVQTYDIGSKLGVNFWWLFIDNINDDMQWLKTLLVFLVFFQCIVRDAALYYLLPYYHIKTLELAAALQAANTTLAGLCVFFEILSLSDATMSGNPLEIIWVILSPLMMIIYVSNMWHYLIRVMIKGIHELNMFEVVHKRQIFRYLMKTRIDPNQEKHRIDLRYFLLRSRVSSLLRYWNKTFADFLQDKKGIQEISKRLLTEILKKHPKSELAKVNLAYFYVKYENSFLLANNLIEEVLSHTPTFRARLSMSLVRLELQKKLYIQYAHEEADVDQSEGLNMLKFVEVHDRDDELKKHIDEQIKLQMNFWNNFLSHQPEMGTLASISTKVSERRQKVAKAWQRLLAVRDPKFTRPLLMYGLYSSFVNNEAVLGEKCVEQYQKDVKRYSHITEKDQLCDNTLFSDKTIQVSMSGLKTKLGRILDCSSRIDLIFGWRKDLLIGRDVKMIMPPFFQEKHDGFLLRHYNTGTIRVLNQTIPVPVLASDGYVIPAFMHIKINPVVEFGLSYISTLRPTNLAKTMVLVRKDGSIDGLAREFAEDMNILHRKSNEVLKIFDFCPSFRAVNNAFNIMAYRTLIANNEASPTHHGLEGDSNHGDATTPHRGHRTSLVETTGDLDKTRRRKGEATPGRGSMSNILDIDNEVQTLFEQFTMGATLSFYPQRSYPVVGNKINLFKESHIEINPILYNVQVKQAKYGKDFIKILALERAVTDEDEMPNLTRIDEEKNSISRKTSKTSKTSEDNTNRSFDIEADEKCSKTGQKDLVKKVGYHPTWEQKKKQTQAKLGLLTPVVNNNKSWNKEDNAGIHIDESAGDLSVLDEIHTPEIKSGSKGFELNKGESSPYYNTHTAPNTGREQDKTPRMPLLRTLDDVTKTEKDRERTELETHVPQLKKLVVSAQKNRFKKVVEEAMHVQDSSGHEGGTSMKAHHKDPHLEDNLLKRKLKRLAEKINRGIVEGTKENSIASTYLSKGRKVQTLVSKALKMSNNKRSALLFIYFCIAFVVISVIIEVVQLVTVYNSIQDIKYKTSVIETGLLRINSLVQLEQTAVMYKWWMKGVINITGFGGTVEWMRADADQSLNNLNSLNNELRQEISYISQQYQTMFFKKDVGIYERQYDNSLVLIGTASNFDTIQDIVNKGLSFANLDIPDNVTVPYNVQAPQYIIDNALDDLLISSENSVSILVEDLNTKLDATKRSIVIVYAIYLALVIAFIMVCINYLLIMRKSAKRFMNLFFRLDPQEAEKTKAFLKHFMASLDSDILDIELPDEVLDQTDDGKSMAKSTKNYRRASLSKQYRHQIMLFLKMIPFFTLLILGCVGYILLLISIINQIAQKQIQLQSALETQNQQNLLVAELIEIVIEDPSEITVRNIPASTDFLNNLVQIQQVTELVNNFRQSDQSLESAYEEIFYGVPCESLLAYSDATTQAAYPSCISLSGGSNEIGLVALNSQLYAVLSQLYDIYLLTPKTQDELAQLFYKGAIAMIPVVNTAYVLLKILNDVTSQIFQNKVNQISSESILLSALTLVLIFIAAIWVWFRMVKKLINYEAKDREILQIVPIKLILANRYIRQHLIHDAGGMLDSIKRFL